MVYVEESEALLVEVRGIDVELLPYTCSSSLLHDIARRTVHAWNHHRPQSRSPRRGLVALAMDMPNHGSRLVSETANQSWQGGNERHAIDMAGIVGAARADVSGLMDLVAGYLDRRVDAHVALGWSLGGHAAWQVVFGEERLDAAVVVVGCPDYLGLMTHRAEKAGLDTGSHPLLGSKYFPADLLASCVAHDPRAALFGCPPAPVPTPPLAPAEQTRVRAVLEARGLRGKRVLVCSGADDALVPYARSAPLLAVLADAVGGWYRDGDVVLEDRVYEGVGHRFSAAMVKDAVAFLVEAVDEGPRGEKGKRGRRVEVAG